MHCNAMQCNESQCHATRKHIRPLLICSHGGVSPWFQADPFDTALRPGTFHGGPSTLAPAAVGGAIGADQCRGSSV